MSTDEHKIEEYTQIELNRISTSISNVQVDQPDFHVDFTQRNWWIIYFPQIWTWKNDRNLVDQFSGLNFDVETRSDLG